MRSTFALEYPFWLKYGQIFDIGDHLFTFDHFSDFMKLSSIGGDYGTL